MGCSSGGCARSGCGSGAAAPAGRSAAGCGGGCSLGAAGGGGCDSVPWDGAYRDVAGVRYPGLARTHYVDSTGYRLLREEACIVEGEHGEEFANVVQETGESRKFAGVRGLRRVLRRATADDLRQQERGETLRRDALSFCRARIEERGLGMKLVVVEPSFDGRRITFSFTAEERVDFRDLVRDLAQKFSRRIEMRQVGARDETKMLGGYGICGRPLCCATFLTEFAPVSIRMAKRQGLGANPAKISGNCGRLMCCLRYEEAPEDPAPRGEAEPPAAAPPA